MKRILLLLSMALFPALVRAEATFSDGSQLYESCVSATASALEFQRGYCVGFVEGTASTTDMACFPAGVKLRQVIDVVIDYLREHPENRQGAANRIVQIAISKA